MSTERDNLKASLPGKLDLLLDAAKSVMVTIAAVDGTPVHHLSLDRIVNHHRPRYKDDLEEQIRTRAWDLEVQCTEASLLVSLLDRHSILRLYQVMTEFRLIVPGEILPASEWLGRVSDMTFELAKGIGQSETHELLAQGMPIAQPGQPN